MAVSTTFKDTLIEMIVKKNYFNLSQFMKNNNVFDSTYADYDAVTFACSNQDREALRILLCSGARPYDDRQLRKFKDSPMYHALRFNDSVMAKDLLSFGYSFRKISVSDGSPAESLFFHTNRHPHVLNLIIDAYIKEQYNPPDRYHLAPSHIACMYSDVGVFKKFLDFDKSVVSMNIQKEFDVNLSGASHLHIAVMYGHHGHAWLLLQRGADPLALNNYGRTPVHYAAYREDKQMVKLLFKYLDVKNIRTNLHDFSGISMFHIACWLGPAEVVEDFIRGGQYDINGAIDTITYDHRNRTFFGYTPLHFAVKSGDTTKIELLLAYGALPSVVAGQDNYNQATPLTLAVKLRFRGAIDALTREICWFNVQSVSHDIGFATLYDALFENSSCSNLPILGEWDQCSPLHYAVARRDVTLVEGLLKSGANVNMTDDRGLTPLMLACILTTRMAQLMKGIVVEKGKERSLTEHTRRWFNRADSPQMRIVKLLLENKADVNIPDSEGRTALVFLSTNSLFKWVELDVPDSVKNNLFEYAYDIAGQLLHHGATLTPRCTDGSTLIHALCEVKNMSDLFVTSENAKIQLLKLFVKAGCDLNAKTENGGTALYMALMADLYCLAEQLVKNGANVHATTNAGETALHAVTGSFVPKTREKFVTYLLSMGIDINAKMDDQSTALHLAIRLTLNNNDALVALLLEHGADVDARDSRKATPLHYAIAAGNWVIADTLANFGADMDICNEVNETPLSLAFKMVKNLNRKMAALSIARFIHRMRAIGRRFNPMNESYVEKLATTRINDVGFHAGPIDDEIDRLKSCTIVDGGKKTMYSLLSRSVYGMRHYARNEEFVRFVLSCAFIKEFPLFGPIIVARTKRALVRQRVLDPARLVLSVITGFEMLEIVDHILKDFSDFELHRFIEKSLADPAIRAEVESREQSSLDIE